MPSLKDKLTGKSPSRTGKPKTDRKIVIWVVIAGMLALVIYLFATQGADLGQSKLDAQAAKQKQEQTAQLYQDKVRDPAQSTQEQLRRAQAAADAKKQSESEQLASIATGAPAPVGTTIAPPVMLPPPGEADSDGQLSRLGKANQSINGPAHDAQPSFVMFAAQAKTQHGLPAIGIKPPPGQGTPGGQVSDDDVEDASNPRVASALKQTKDAQKQRDELNKLAAAKAQGISAPGGEADRAWLFQQRNDTVNLTKPNTAVRTDALYWLAPGTVIHMVVEGALDTSLPGSIVARVTSPVYDSRYGHYVVIPAGSTLTGTYNTSVADGQHRAMLAFDTLITPAGGMVNLGALSGEDALGRGGVPGKLHTHFWSRMGIAGLLAVEATAMDRYSRTSDTNSNALFGGGQTGSSGGQILMNVANEEMKRRFATGPNITVPPGSLALVTLTRGISIPPVANSR